MKVALLALFASVLAFGQTAPTTTPITQNSPITADGSTMPVYTAGIGPAWLRGNSNPYAVDVTLGYRPSSKPIYWWTDISTPVSTPTVGLGPVVSTITTGSSWIPVQSASGKVSLMFIGQAGLSTSTATITSTPTPGASPVSVTTTSVSPAFSGSFGVAFRPWKAPVYIFPYVKAANASTSSTSGALATAVLQPGIQIIYGFGGK